MCARFCFDQLEGRSDGVRSRIRRSSEQAVGLAHLYEHGPEIVAVRREFSGVFLGELALAEFYHLCDHFVKAFVVRRVDDLAPGKIIAALFGSLFEFRLAADEDDLQNARFSEFGSGVHDARVRSVREDNGARSGFQLLGQFIENRHFDIPPIKIHYLQLLHIITPHRDFQFSVELGTVFFV